MVQHSCLSTRTSLICLQREGSRGAEGYMRSISSGFTYSKTLSHEQVNFGIGLSLTKKPCTIADVSLT